MVEALVNEYLKVYADAQPGESPEPSKNTIAALRKDPDASFQAIINYSGDLSENLDPRDSDDPFCRLLSSIADLVPELLIPRMINGYWASRYLFICAAAASESEVFIPTIIDLLNDRSIYIKTLVLELITKWSHLQITDMLPMLDKLAKMKSFQEGIDQKLLEKARNAIAQGT